VFFCFLFFVWVFCFVFLWCFWLGFVVLLVCFVGLFVCVVCCFVFLWCIVLCMADVGGISDRVSDLVSDVRAGFERQERANVRIEANFDRMVTHSEFVATVQRLEARDSSIEDRLEAGLVDLRAQMSVGLSRVSGEVSDGFERTERIAAARSVKNRWLVSSLIGFAGLLNVLVFNFLDRFF
jgi:hypothetical protein